MQRRIFTIGMLSLLAGSVLGPTAALADPPSWAPAHGWRRKNGKESEFTGKKKSSDDKNDLEESLNRQSRLQRSEQARLERENRELRQQNQLAQSRRQTTAASLERQSRQAEIDRLRRENALLRQQRALRP